MTRPALAVAVQHTRSASPPKILDPIWNSTSGSASKTCRRRSPIPSAPVRQFDEFHTRAPSPVRSGFQANPPHSGMTRTQRRCLLTERRAGGSEFFSEVPEPGRRPLRRSTTLGYPSARTLFERRITHFNILQRARCIEVADSGQRLEQQARLLLQAHPTQQVSPGT